MTIESKLDILMSRYVRMRDVKATGYCITCGKPINYNGCDAGHWIPRGIMATRWHEDNVHAQCVTCNRFGGVTTKMYRERLMVKIGKQKVRELEKLKRTFKKYTRDELVAIGSELEKKIKGLLNE
jgi:hypothetical protein